MATQTTNFSLSKPAVNSATDEDLWGDLLNANMDTIDSTLKAARDMVGLAKTAAYTVVAGDRNKMITCDATSAAFSVTLLPAATAGDGFILTVKKTDSSTNTVTVDGDGTETIDGNLTNSIASQYDSVSYVCDGSNWSIVGSSVPNVPVGSIMDFGGTSAPSGFLNCDGSAVSRTTYLTLFTAIGTTWGVGDGSTTFNVPDLNRRATIGSGGTGTGTIGNSVGDSGGEEDHTLTTAEMPSHTHTVQAIISDSGADITGAIAGSGDLGTIDTGSTGSGTAHNTIQPSAVVLKIIKT